MIWSGRFEDQQRALARLYIIVPLVVFIIFILLFGTFQSVGHALLIMLNLPFALIGGTLALFLWGTNFNHLGGGRLHCRLRRRACWNWRRRPGLVNPPGLRVWAQSY